jgi:hypothetical protein
MEPIPRKAPGTIHLTGSSLPHRDELGLIQPHDKPGEWWVTLNQVAVIGFSGDEARSRAEQHFRELVEVAVPGAAETDHRPDDQ